eukprot:CAMPEP_0177681304 /NCGR_PEP_ID=MMETSP0447-20121125/30639_1 /TAXON_ID=0 /ORGANISM="Stygamoeba regulata, Strain BSH-02190019" /LENGTH=977 /DNA_ID=CAMNT_0019190701 /DNA_START=152 /DNA_END=3083 /DNA_ORIENTATION=-
MGKGKEAAPVEAFENPFGISTEKLQNFQENKALNEIEADGGLEAIMKSLQTSEKQGIPPLHPGAESKDYNDRVKAYGKNEFDEPPMPSFISLWLETFKDVIIQILCVAAVVSLIVGMILEDPQTGWIEGVAIICAVLIVATVTATNDYTKEKISSEALNKVKNDFPVKVRRGGHVEATTTSQIVVGDIVVLTESSSGHQLKVDESSMTGESDEVEKNHEEPFMLSGCEVTQGEGTMLVTVVGMSSMQGKMLAATQEEQGATPLQESLEEIAKIIGYMGFTAAGLIFIALTIRFIVVHTVGVFEWADLTEFIEYFLICVTVVVVAVPEGLPLAVTISLAYSMRQMLHDQNLVRHLSACETMGVATTICSDKTGTLTENQMTVAEMWIGGNHLTTVPDPNSLDSTLRDHYCYHSSVNSNANIKFKTSELERNQFIGNKTECALIYLVNTWGFSYEDIRESAALIHLFPFSSRTKSMSTIVNRDGDIQIHSKGAAEILITRCTQYVDATGAIQPIDSAMREQIMETIDKMAGNALRALTLAYASIGDASSNPDYLSENYWKEPPQVDLVLISVVGIRDPLRQEVPDAIARCERAGITVRMVTGDNRKTAERIAIDCGIIKDGKGLVMEGKEFRNLPEEELRRILPELRVLARSSPTDKHKLVVTLKSMGEVVAVTGDGTNDAAALRAAHVGLAMGIAGTELAKEASDIIIMDDNFKSIVRSVVWGRRIRDNIRCFLQFQLTINIVALCLVFVGAASGLGTPITAVQLLWVNLIMDTMAALALGTEKPNDSLLDRPPSGRTERIISPIMWRNMIGMAIYQLAVLIFLLFAADSVGLVPSAINKDKEPSVHYTFIFNTFVFMQIFNEINSRRCYGEWNIFAGFFTNWIFIGVLVVTVAIQVLLVNVAGIFFFVERLSWNHWLYSVGIGLSVLVVYQIVRLIPAPEIHSLKYRKLTDEEIEEDEKVLAQDKKALEEQMQQPAI